MQPTQLHYFPLTFPYALGLALLLALLVALLQLQILAYAYEKLGVHPHYVTAVWLRGLIGTAIVALGTHRIAYPVPGVGIAVPTLVPPLIEAAVGLLLGWRSAAPLAYVAGCMGTLIGADLMNLGQIQGLGAPVASIGGAGTYDGIFATGSDSGRNVNSP